MSQSNLFPQQLTKLGFVSLHVNEAHIIVPPLCEVAAGYFLMGSDPKRDKDASDSERPQHWVTLLAYHIGKFPVTVAEYELFVRQGGGTKPTTRGEVTWERQLQRLDHPVVCVQWRDAVAYTQWLSKVTGQKWRLPTEAEWEKAARWDARNNYPRIYPWGDSFDKNLCNTNASNLRMTNEIAKYPRGVSPCGAYDMAGNVWEWTSSAFMPYPYDPADGREDLKGQGNRVLRGGAWKLMPQVARTASRNNEHPDHVAGFFYDIGFRLLREI